MGKNGYEQSLGDVRDNVEVQRLCYRSLRRRGENCDAEKTVEITNGRVCFKSDKRQTPTHLGTGLQGLQGLQEE